VRAVVVAHGEVDPGDVAHVRGADLIVAADGGSAHLEGWGIAPHVVVGDLDSLSPEARSRLAGLPVERHPAEKDKTDTELAVERAFAAGADEVVVVGALGGPRADHAVANTLLLARDGRIRLVLGPLSMRVVRGGERARIDRPEGEIVTLLAVSGDALGVTTEGLRYPLRSETLRLGSSRGVSNEVASPGASVTLASGSLLVIEGGTLAPRTQQQTKA
jgi:thiamine pyrophosphokinase